jgi:ATP adenylyltransferase
MTALLTKSREFVLNEDPSIEGFNIGTNNGVVAGQSIFHVHIHLIPRRRGDVEDPRGGVRGVIPKKRPY